MDHTRGLRGGSWNNNDATNLSAAYRNNNHPDHRNKNIGFRPVVVLAPQHSRVESPDVRQNRDIHEYLERAYGSPDPDPGSGGARSAEPKSARPHRSLVIGLC